jgi:hypothetical protein
VRSCCRPRAAGDLLSAGRRAAGTKLRRNEQILAAIHGIVDVPLGQLPVLAGLKIAGTASTVQRLGRTMANYRVLERTDSAGRRAWWSNGPGH